VSRGFFNRYANQISDVNTEILRAGCEGVSITGHSLGGAVAQIHAYKRAGHRDQFKEVVAYNSPAIGNIHMQTLMSNRMPFINDFRLYCRVGDPFNSVPVDHNGWYRLSEQTRREVPGCTHGYPRMFTGPIQTFKNHFMKYWLGFVDRSHVEL